MQHNILNKYIMKKLFNFLENLSQAEFDLLGFPTVKFYSDYYEVYFDTFATIRFLTSLSFPCDEFRMFASDKNPGCLTIVYTIYGNIED